MYLICIVQRFEPQGRRFINFLYYHYYYFDLFVNAAGVVCHQPGLLGTDLHAVGCGGFVETLN